jgi:quercetin dioxygenase-like cupin family protein
VITVDLNDIELMDSGTAGGPDRVTFPFHSGTGTASTAAVLFEVEPGNALGMHTDSAEEILLILAGTVEASLGEERGQLSAGQAALIPAMVPHGIRNIGNETARCVGFFAAAEVVSTFDQPMMPVGQPVVGTPAGGRTRSLATDESWTPDCPSGR